MPKIPLFVDPLRAGRPWTIGRLFTPKRPKPAADLVKGPLVDLRAVAAQRRSRAAVWVSSVIASCREQTVPLYVVPETVSRPLR